MAVLVGILALVQTSLGAYGVWFELSGAGDPGRLLMAALAAAGGTLAFAAALVRRQRLAASRVLTFVGGVMGLALGHPGYLAPPVLLMLASLFPRAGSGLPRLGWRASLADPRRDHQRESAP